MKVQIDIDVDQISLDIAHDMQEKYKVTKLGQQYMDEVAFRLISTDENLIDYLQDKDAYKEKILNECVQINNTMVQMVDDGKLQENDRYLDYFLKTMDNGNLRLFKHQPEDIYSHFDNLDYLNREDTFPSDVKKMFFKKVCNTDPMIFESILNEESNVEKLKEMKDIDMLYTALETINKDKLIAMYNKAISEGKTLQLPNDLIVPCYSSKGENEIYYNVESLAVKGKTKEYTRYMIPYEKANNYKLEAIGEYEDIPALDLENTNEYKDVDFKTKDVAYVEDKHKKIFEEGDVFVPRSRYFDKLDIDKDMKERIEAIKLERRKRGLNDIEYNKPHIPSNEIRYLDFDVYLENKLKLDEYNKEEAIKRREEEAKRVQKSIEALERGEKISEFDEVKFFLDKVRDKIVLLAKRTQNTKEIDEEENNKKDRPNIVKE